MSQITNVQSPKKTSSFAPPPSFNAVSSPPIRFISFWGRINQCISYVAAIGSGLSLLGMLVDLIPSSPIAILACLIIIYLAISNLRHIKTRDRTYYLQHQVNHLQNRERAFILWIDRCAEQLHLIVSRLEKEEHRITPLWNPTIFSLGKLHSLLDRIAQINPLLHPAIVQAKKRDDITPTNGLLLLQQAQQDQKTLSTTEALLTQALQLRQKALTSTSSD